MQVYMREKHDWSLNGCLWMSTTDGLSNAKKTKYLSDSFISDNTLPVECRKHWKREVDLQKLH